MKIFTIMLIFAFVLFAVTDASNVLANKAEKRQAKKTSTSTTTTKPTSTRKIVSDCLNPYVQRCGVTCCTGIQHCCVDNPTACCWPKLR